MKLSYRAGSAITRLRFGAEYATTYLIPPLLQHASYVRPDLQPCGRTIPDGPIPHFTTSRTGSVFGASAMLCPGYSLGGISTMC